jgi:hypothetical protein
MAKTRTILWLLAAGCNAGAAHDGAAPAVGAQNSASHLSASLSATPNPVTARQPLHLLGCGYAASLAIVGEDWGPEGMEPWGAAVDSTGCFAVDRQASSYAGSHTLKAFQRLKGTQATLVAEASLTVDSAPLSLVSESYFFRWNPSATCVSEDDTLDWSAAGWLAPGQSWSFSPRFPDCNDARAVMVHVAAGSSALLRVSTVMPVSDGISNNPGQAGKTIAATTAGGTAQLCMFPNTSFTAPTGYTITVTNIGTTTASNVTLTGQDYNDWIYFYWSPCLAADADHDGWSDSYEHAMAQLIYPTGNYLNGALPAGSDYLRSCGTPIANDEFDFWPPDFDDDGVVTQADVDLLAANLGQGNGIAWAQVSPNSGIPQYFWNHVGAWNRFDLNADGMVDSKDLAIVQSMLGARCAP